MRRRLFVVIALAAIGSAGCSSSSTTASTTPTSPSTGAPTVATFTAAGSLTLAVGDSHQVKAVAVLTDGTTEILTNTATWTSSNAAVATVDASGIVTAVGVGTASIAVAVGSVNGSVNVTVAAATSDAQSFIGTVTGANGLSGTLEVAVLASSSASGTLYVGQNSVRLIGRFDSGASVLNVSGGAYAILGTVANGVVTGTITDLSNNVGGFAALDSTHTAVTTYCGTYATAGGGGGVWNMAVSTTGAAAGSSTVSDGSGAPVVFAGRGDGGSVSMAAGGGYSLSGATSGGLASGSITSSSTPAGTFTASTTACR